MHDSELVFVGDVVDGLPDVALDVECFNFLN